MSEPCCNWWCAFWCYNLFNECIGCVYRDCVNCGSSNPNHEIMPRSPTFKPGTCKYPRDGSWDPEAEFDPTQYEYEACGDDGGEGIPMGLMASRPRAPLAKHPDDVLKWFIGCDTAAAPVRDAMKGAAMRTAFHAHIRATGPPVSCATGTHLVHFVRHAAEAAPLRDALTRPGVTAALAAFTADQQRRRAHKDHTK